ncbi:uncharacterized protein [Diabrotica undecimpunctata]|uniref:uncharacterized protein n=1 Tax=Diabrotica undecimpunctata TaxID=50387 RepID=UPI003B63CFB5
MEVYQESINVPKEECKIKIENIDVYDVEVSCSVKTEIKDELELDSCSLNKDAHIYFDSSNSLDSKNKAFNIEDIKLEEDKPDIIHIDNGFLQTDHRLEKTETFRKQLCHKEQSISQKEKTFKCDICLKEFNHEPNFKRHLGRHTREKCYQCELCLKRFDYPRDLKKHHRRHTEEKPYQCETCAKQFTLKRNLNGHMLVHTGEKYYECEICLNIFARAGTLKRHYMKHTGEKPFECGICCKQYARRDNLNNHMKVHSGEQYFK